MLQKLKDKLNTKPKFKLALKVIFFACNLAFTLWGILLTIILFIGAFTLSKNTGDLQQQVRERKPVENAITFNNFDIYSSSELISLENLINYVDWVYRADGIDLYNISAQYQRGFSVGGSAFFIESSENITTSNIENNNVRFMTIQTLRFTASVKNVYNVNSSAQRFMLDFISTTSTNRYLRLTYYRVINNQLSTSATWYTTGLYYYVDGDLTYYASDLALVYKNPQNVDNAWSRQFLNYYGLGTDSTADRYETGYNTGYTLGQQVGYQSGYDVGYEDGRGAQIGIVNNPFDLIANAFIAIASILDIRILPGLSLGMLIFTPLLVTIIIVVVKMIKG